jgi:hypothetical protein
MQQKKIGCDTPYQKALYVVTGIALVSGALLTLLSWFNLCTEACVEEHNYRFFGFSFNWIGLIYFGLLLLFYGLAKRSQIATRVTGLMLAAGLGAELLFLLIQKYMIGSWCPLCLAIASCILIAFAAFFTEYFTARIEAGTDLLKGMKELLTLFAAMVLGFVLALSGTAKHDLLEEEKNSIEQRLFLGNNESPIEVYIFTSWVCPACNHFEPALERMASRIMESARMVFVEHGQDETSLNFLPYALSFTLNNPTAYIPLRHLLKDISKETDTPTDEQVEAGARALGQKYRQLNYADVSVGIEYFKHLKEKFKVSALPTVIVINPHTGQEKRFSGLEATAAHILAAIQSMEEASLK